MKKFMLGLLAVISMVFLVTSCEMKYDEDYEQLVQWYAPHTGDTGDWMSPGPDVLMTYNASSGLYELDITTGRKNVGISVCTDANYSNQLNWDKADEATQASFSWKEDFGNKQLVIKKAGDYKVTVDGVNKTWTVTAK